MKVRAGIVLIVAVFAVACAGNSGRGRFINSPSGFGDADTAECRGESEQPSARTCNAARDLSALSDSVGVFRPRSATLSTPTAGPVGEPYPIACMDQFTPRSLQEIRNCIATLDRYLTAVYPSVERARRNLVFLSETPDLETLDAGSRLRLLRDIREIAEFLSDVERVEARLAFFRQGTNTAAPASGQPNFVEQALAAAATALGRLWR